MIVLGVILLVVGYWLIPDAVPDIPPQLDRLCVDLGWLFLVIGIVLLLLSLFGHPVGNRRFWY
jgi:hypothetical protein